MAREVLLELRTEPFVAEREWTVECIPVLTASVAVPRPVPLEGRIPRRVDRYYQLQCRAFLRYCQRWLLPQAKAAYQEALETSAPLPCLHAELTYRVTYNRDGLWSLCTQSRETAVSGPALLTRRGDTWDLREGCPVELSAFFPPRSGWKKGLLHLAAEEIQRQERSGVSRYRENWCQALRRRFNAQNYCLTEEGLAFFYPMYALAPAAEGIPTFTVPYGELSLRLPGK